VLVVDIGGSSVKFRVAGPGLRRSSSESAAKFKSGAGLTPRAMMKELLQYTRDWRYDVVSLGYPGVVRAGKIAREPNNLGRGWIDFDFRAAFGRPVRIINDAAMQAMGAYRGGTMLFLGLGTGLGSALIVDGAIVPMELGHMYFFSPKLTYEGRLSKSARRRRGLAVWRRDVAAVVRSFSQALLPGDIVLGGGGVKHLNRLPPRTRRGNNADAFRGGMRLWSDRRR
jgi:predicted NBD/HSP70 family sugar kinase